MSKRAQTLKKQYKKADKEKPAKTTTNDELFEIVQQSRERVSDADVERHVKCALMRIREKASLGKMDATYSLENYGLRKRVAAILRDDHGLKVTTREEIDAIFIDIVPVQQAKKAKTGE